MSTRSFNEDEDLQEIRHKIDSLEYLEARYGDLDDEYDESPSFVKISHEPRERSAPRQKPRPRRPQDNTPSY